MNCAGCLGSSKGSNNIKCSLTKCGKTYCSSCIDTSSIGPDRKKTWICPDCIAINKKGGDNSATPVRATSDAQNITTRKKPTAASVASNGELSELTAEVRNLTQEIHSLKSKLEEATSSLSRCHERLDIIAATTGTNQARINSLEDREKILDTTITSLQRELNYQTQRNLLNEIEVSGIPESNNENLQHIFMLAAKKIGVELVDQDIDWVSRVGSRPSKDPKRLEEGKSKFPRTVVARLVRRATRDKIINSSKVRRNITSGDLDIAGPLQKIYYNERLTKENRVLFREARVRSKNKKFAYCWCRNGSIYVRQSEGKPVQLIQCYDDLDRIFPA